MTIKERRTPQKVLKEVCLRAGGRWYNGVCSGGRCEICHGKKMDIRGLKFMHKKRRGMGGTTDPKIHSAKNVFRSCYVCDEENDGVRSPRSQPGDRPPMPALGFKGLHSYSKAQQCGIKEK